MQADSAGAGLYAEYRRETEGETLPRALLRAAFVLFAVNTAFIGVDAVIYPEKLAAFLPTRILLDLILAVTVWTRRRRAVASAFVICGAGGWMLLTVIHGTGGGSSDYYAGLILLFIGIGVLGPLSARQGFWAISSIFACYVAVALYDGIPEAPQGFVLNLFFLGSAAFVGTMSCAHLDRMRFADFLQRREIEQARDELRELDAAKSRFTANIHHELRTPLTLTLAPVEAMLGGEFGELSEVQRSYLKTVRSNGLRLLKLINNLLDLAKIESQQLAVKRRPAQVGDIVRDIVDGAVPLAERKGVALTTRGLAALPLIHADPEALEKVVVNLLGNALKFTDAGQSIEVRGAEEEGGVHLVVADTGLGIPRDQLGRIFDRFAQVDGSSTRRHEGTGIGLSLVKELVGLHGGRIWAESEGVGRGAEMHVVLPPGDSDFEGEDAVEGVVIGSAVAASGSLAAMQQLDLETDEREFGDDLRLSELQHNVERTQQESEDPETGAGALPPNTPEVLIVEDNADMRRLLAFLVGQEFRVRQARNGREGLEAVHAARPDLVLSDVMMPQMSGIELCAALKSDEETRGVPVVLVTSKAEHEMKIEGLEQGADDYVTKPFHPRELLARVRSLVRLRRLQEELGIRNALLESTNEELRSTMQELHEAGAQLVQAERLAAVGQLAAGVAHEVNNPVNFALNAMKTLRAYVADVRSVTERVAALDLTRGDVLESELADIAALRERLDFEQVGEALLELGEIVTEGLERTARLVGDLRDFATPGERRSSDVDVRRGLESTLQLMRPAMDQAGVEVRAEIAELLPAVEGDASALNQVFLNLLKNAAEAFEGGRGTIHVRAISEGSSVLVEIQDDGPGVAVELRARVFDPFFSTKAAGKGSGLGLSITRRIVKEHGGRIDLLSPESGGTCFRVRLPGSGAAQEPARVALAGGVDGAA
jgi:signal transduction histidine kinase